MWTEDSEAGGILECGRGKLLVLCVVFLAGKILNTENAEKNEVTEKEGMRDGKSEWKDPLRITTYESKYTAAYPAVAPISFSLAAARLASSVPG